MRKGTRLFQLFNGEILRTRLTYCIPFFPPQNKAPPHVEGELLKQNTKGMLGKKGWTKFYFIVSRYTGSLAKELGSLSRLTSNQGTLLQHSGVATPRPTPGSVPQ